MTSEAGLENDQKQSLFAYTLTIAAQFPVCAGVD